MTFFGSQRPRGFHYTSRYSKRRRPQEAGVESSREDDHPLLRSAFARKPKPSPFAGALRSVPFIVLMLLVLTLLMLLIAR